MRPWTAGIFATIATLAATATAEACVSSAPVNITAVTAQILLCDFSVISNGNFTESGPDVEGPLLVGGNLTTTGATDLNSHGVVLGTTAGTTAINSYGELNVFGNTTLAANPVLGSGTVVYVGGTNTNSSFTFITAAPGSVLHNYAFPGSFATNIWGQITSLSTSLSLLSSLSTFNSTTGVFDGVANSNNQAVFSVPLSELTGPQSYSTLSFTGCLALSTPCDAVINVTGTGSFTQDFTYNIASGQANLIWNFESGITSVTTDVFSASILAPDASVTTSGHVFGSVIASTITADDEIDLPIFDCSDNLCVTTAPPNGVPEPGSLALFGSAVVAFVAFAAIRRRVWAVGPGPTI